VAGAGVWELFLYELERSAGGGHLHGTASDCGHRSDFSCGLDGCGACGSRRRMVNV
jgi:hypothetical protein